MSTSITGDPGRSLLQEVQTVRQQVTVLLEVVGGLIDLQKAANEKLDNALATKAPSLKPE